MTRDEAIATFTRESDLDDIAAAIIDGLEALGILKLDEPKLSRAEQLQRMSIIPGRIEVKEGGPVLVGWTVDVSACGEFDPPLNYEREIVPAALRVAGLRIMEK